MIVLCMGLNSFASRRFEVGRGWVFFFPFFYGEFGDWGEGKFNTRQCFEFLERVGKGAAGRVLSGLCAG